MRHLKHFVRIDERHVEPDSILTMRIFVLGLILPGQAASLAATGLPIDRRSIPLAARRVKSWAKPLGVVRGERQLHRCTWAKFCVGRIG